MANNKHVITSEIMSGKGNWTQNLGRSKKEYWTLNVGEEFFFFWLNLLFFMCDKYFSFQKPQVTSLFGADTLWSKGYTGANVKMAIFDTGIRANHPHFRNIKVFLCFCFHFLFTIFTRHTLVYFKTINNHLEQFLRSARTGPMRIR